jgi:hypothetical protein
VIPNQEAEHELQQLSLLNVVKEEVERKNI